MDRRRLDRARDLHPRVLGEYLARPRVRLPPTERSAVTNLFVRDFKIMIGLLLAVGVASWMLKHEKEELVFGIAIAALVGWWGVILIDEVEARWGGRVEDLWGTWVRGGQ
ncbi:hypothetical protein P171DRAFT_491988 [Karstenula rhodostoma CBS 690.94]|uniref:Uncharacterized protein n=1 Tax=Karstenula rhodostoma CBS 690.94 TaxID=1392251 RepID=A0A9P4U474_9PLEO|nr:hypothetical protein P171DRAFT_491988 [Karstenula rhodostoma CBS 690.94]